MRRSFVIQYLALSYSYLAVLLRCTVCLVGSECRGEVCSWKFVPCHPQIDECELLCCPVTRRYLVWPEYFFRSKSVEATNPSVSPWSTGVLQYTVCIVSLRCCHFVHVAWLSGAVGEPESIGSLERCTSFFKQWLVVTKMHTASECGSGGVWRAARRFVCSIVSFFSWFCMRCEFRGVTCRLAPHRKVCIGALSLVCPCCPLSLLSLLSPFDDKTFTIG